MGRDETTKEKTDIYSLTVLPSFEWVALAQQNPFTQTPKLLTRSGSAGQLQTISCTRRTNQSNSGNASVAASRKMAQPTTGTPVATGNSTMGSAGTGSKGNGSTGTGSTEIGNLPRDMNNTASGTVNTNGAGSTAAQGNIGGSSANISPGTQDTAETQGTTDQNSGSASIMQGGKSLSSLSAAEVCFLDKAVTANQFEILSSQLAAQKSSSSAIKKVAQQIIKDHQAAGVQLKALAARYGAVPISRVNTQQQAQLTTLKTQGGKCFDITYLTQQVSAHDEAVGLFRSYSQPASLPDQDVRSFASKILPGLTMQSRTLKTIQKTLSTAGPGTAVPATKSVSSGK